MFFVKKADGSLRMVCDWRQLNKITIKNKACMPNADDLFDVVQDCEYFSKLDLHSGYNQVRIKDSDVAKTAKNTPFDHFQFRVMGFGLTNAPATFQTMMNHILRPYLRKFAVVFLDDILIFSKTWKEHLSHVEMVLQSLEKNQLYCKPSKCQFGATEILFLGHRVSGFSIGPDSEKLKAVADWPVPRSVSDVRKFLGFANNFRRFIDHYSSISRSLEEATGKNTRFVWNESRQHAFEQLKKALMQAPVLSLANVDQPFRIHTDASDFAVAGVLLQEVNSCWCPVAYASRSLSPAERNYTASERETVAVIYALQTWRMYLFKHFDLFTDNMGVVYLRTKPNLTRREARWVEFLADYDFTCHHQSGKTNVADALSRRPDYDCQINALEYSLDVNSELAQSISAGYVNDPDLSPVIQRLNTSREDTLHERYTWNSRTQHLYLTSSGQRRLCIPKGPIRLKLMQDHHDCLIAGHQGRDRTYLKLSRRFYWPGMSRSI